MSELTVFQNENFEVRTHGPTDDVIDVDGRIFDEYYIVFNRVTGIVEYKTPGIVDAIVYAHNTDHMLENKPWTWVEKATEQTDWVKALGKPSPEEAN